MAFKLLLPILFLVYATSGFSQDVLYTTSGNKLKAKVLEINANDIKYKDFNNLDGPTYVIMKLDIVLIQYANGVTDIINSNPPTVAPKITETVQAVVTNTVVKTKPVEKKPLNLYYLNSNMLSINALALANGDVTLLYDRELFNSKMCLTFLGGYSFNARMGVFNAPIVDSQEYTKKKFDAGFGISFMPRNTKRVQYFVGLLGKYMAYDYKKVIDTGNNQRQYKNAVGNQTAIMVTNGWVYRISPNFNFKIFGSIGFAINTPELKDAYIGMPKAYLGYCFGYRF